MIFMRNEMEGRIQDVFSLRNIGFSFSLFMESSTVKYVYLLFLVLIILLDITFVYQVKTNWSVDNFNVEQKGDSRFATLEEIKEQYKEIPDRDKKYNGNPGMIISRYGEKLYIDTSYTNNLILGMTRSGKGEFFVYPTIDVYSRAENQASMIIADPKLELYRSSKKTLEARGYEVHLFDLIDPLTSMGFNPLALITSYFKDNKYDEAELMSDSFAYSVFNPGKAESGGNEKFFDETAAGVFSALILSHVADCLNEDEIQNKKRLNHYNRKRKAYDRAVQENPDTKESLDEKYYSIEKQCMIENQDEFLCKKIQFIPPEVMYYHSDKYEKCINVYSILNTLIELSQLKIPNTDETALDEYFRRRPPLDAGKMRYASAMVAGDRTKGSILANTTQGLKVFTSRAIARMTAQSTMDLRKIGFGEKPIAIFMGIPDYDRSKNFLAVSFIRQVYYYLAETCSKTNGKCKRHVKFIIDEFGNMPAIDDMENMITVCLGRNISFDLYIQDFSQLPRVYGDAGETIESNCGNKIYILSNDYDTADKFSKLLGPESYLNLQRTGHKLELSKTFTESIDDKPLLRPNQLLNLKSGECVVSRRMTRKDRKGKDITPYPIFNSIETGTKMKYRHEYLTDTFPDPDQINLADLDNESCKEVEPLKHIWDYEISFQRYEKPEEIEILAGCDEFLKKNVYEILHEQLGEDLEQYGIPSDGEISISRLIDIINKNDYVDPFKKAALLGLLSGGDSR